MIQLYKIFGISKFMETENRTEIVRGCGGRGNGEYCLIGTKFLLGMIKNILWTDSDDDYTTF